MHLGAVPGSQNGVREAKSSITRGMKLIDEINLKDHYDQVSINWEGFAVPLL